MSVGEYRFRANVTTRYALYPYVVKLRAVREPRKYKPPPEHLPRLVDDSNRR